MIDDPTQPLPGDIAAQILAELKGTNSRLDSLETRLTSVQDRLSSVEGGLRSVDSRLTSVETKIERQQVETKPIWERALAEILELRTESKAVARNIRTVNDYFVKTLSDLRDIDERLANLESQGASRG